MLTRVLLIHAAWRSQKKGTVRPSNHAGVDTEALHGRAQRESKGNSGGHREGRQKKREVGDWRVQIKEERRASEVSSFRSWSLVSSTSTVWLQDLHIYIFILFT